MNIFDTVELPRVPSNSFGMGNDFKLSLNMGYLVPVNLLECIPGDNIKGNSTIMARMAPMTAPVMHKVDVDIHHFFVPNRIVWPGWEKFITSGVPGPNTPAFPYFQNFNSENGSIYDYMGLPSSPAPGLAIDKVSAIPFAAYNKIFQEFYRDQNLQDDVKHELIDGLNDHLLFSKLFKRAWQHDYFTSNLPWAQKGNPVSLPLSGFGDVVVRQNPGQDLKFGYTNGFALPPSTTTPTNITNPDPNFSQQDALFTDVNGAQLEYKGGLIADTSALPASAVSINDLRWAFRLQEFLERNARGGTRYIETIKAHFNVDSSDRRLQRPEFIGGNRTPMIISEVLQQSETQESPQGNMAGHGLSVGSGNFNYNCEEHGYFISIMSIRPKTAYQQGMPRTFTKFDPMHYAWPTFANVGEQAILNKELYYDLSDNQNENTFGYLPRYAEYKYQSSRVAGDFKSNLSFWHMGRIFNSRPGLNSSFIESDPTHRIFAVTNPAIHKIYCHVMHNIKMRRRLPKFGVPSF